MLKKLLYGLLTILLLPLGAITSALIVSLILVSFLLASPLVILACAVKFGSFLSNKLINHLFSENTALKNITTLFAPALIAFVTYMPVAFIVLILTAIIVPLSFLALSPLISFGIAKKIIDASYSFFEKRQEYTPARNSEHEYEISLSHGDRNISRHSESIRKRTNNFPIINSEDDIVRETDNKDITPPDFINSPKG